MNKIKSFLLIGLFLFSNLIFSQEKNNKKILISLFNPYKSSKESGISEKIYERLAAKLNSLEYEVVLADSTEQKQNLARAKNGNFLFFIDGYYRREENGNLNLYGQIYNPEKEILIDAFNQSNDYTGLEGIALDPQETKISDEQNINDFSTKIGNRVKSNIKRSERMENINEFVKNNPIGKDIAFPLPQEDLAAASQDVFKILSEKDDVVVSVSKFAQKTTEAPADVTVISREQIRRSGFRNLTEALNFVPQVYTHWVGQNWSSDFRGLFVNNQIERRVLYLQDGKKLNDYFHFGEFYSDVYTDMERIEKIEVIKGPGAALYGNNSITGVVNIITRKPTKKNEMEIVTEYDSVLRNLTTRALYYSKFSEKLSVSLDVSRFEGKGLYTSGYNSWGGNRFYDPNLGANAANFNSTPANSTMGTSEYGRNTAEVDTSQRLWTSTGMMADNGKWFPNYNLDVKYGDWNLKSFYMSKRTSWIPPQVDAGAFGGDTVYGSPRNDRIWGTGVVSLDYTPSYLEKYEANVKIFRQLNINSDYRDKDYQGFAQATNPPGAPAGYGNNATARLASQSYLNYIQAMGGGVVKRYASTARAEGVEFQLTPFKFENKDSVVKVFRFMTGGNMQSVNYINYQVNVGRNGLIDRRQQGIADDGRQYGLWTQLTTTFKTDTTLVLGLRYDAQKIYNVYRHQNGMETDYAFESITDPYLRTPSTGGNTTYVGPGNSVNLTTPVNDPFGNRTANGYVQPFQRKDYVAEDKTPRIALIQNFKSTDTTVKLMYAEAFRMVTPQELIRLPRELGNAQSEKVRNKEVNIIQPLLKGALILNADFFRMTGSTIYAFNAATLAFGQSPEWSNTGGSLALTYVIDSRWRANASYSSYQLRRPSDSSFLNTLFTPKPQALNSPTKLWKAALSRSVINDNYTISLEFYYNGSIFLMENPPRTNSQVLNNDGTLRELPPLPGETINASSYLGYGVGGGITRYRVWKVPESKFFNLTFSSNLGNELILVISAKNVFNQRVLYPLDIESGSFTSPTLDPHQLLGFGRELYFKLGYRF